MLVRIRLRWWVIYANWLGFWHFLWIGIGRYSDPARFYQHEPPHGVRWSTNPVTGEKLGSMYCADCGETLERPK